MTEAGELREKSADLDVMVVWGEKDVIVPVGSPDDVRRACGSAEVSYVPDAGHLPYAENGEAFWGAVLPFLASATRAKT